MVEGTNDDDDDDTPDRQTDRRDVAPGGEDPVGASERGGIRSVGRSKRRAHRWFCSFSFDISSLSSRPSSPSASPPSTSQRAPSLCGFHCSSSPRPQWKCCFSSLGMNDE